MSWTRNNLLAQRSPPAQESGDRFKRPTRDRESVRSIRTHLTLSLLIGFALLLGGGGTLVYFLSRSALYSQFDAQLRTEALTVVTFTRQERDGDIDVDFSDRYLREFDDEVGTRFFQLTRSDGSLVAVSDSLDKTRLPQKAGTLEQPVYWNFELPDHRPARAIGLRFVPRSEERRHHNPNLELSLVVAADRRGLERTLGSLLTTLLLAAGGCLLGTLGLVGWTVRRGLSPLNRVADQAAVIDATKLQTRFPMQAVPVELRPICERLNELLARLELSFDRERRFSADVAHELRTPIAELRSLAEVALKWPGGDADTKTAFSDTLAATRQMEGIVTGLLAITRCEAGKQQIVREPVEIAGLVNDLWQSHADRARGKELLVRMDVPAEAQLETDRTLFGSILANLFSNAVEYTPAKGTLLIRHATQGDRWSFSVTNTVGHLRPEDLPHLFQRFWRKDTARSTPEHSGLGLSLARAFAEALGMNLRAELVNERELAMTLEAKNEA